MKLQNIRGGKHGQKTDTGATYRDSIHWTACTAPLCESYSSICHRAAFFPLLALTMDCTHTRLHIYHLQDATFKWRN